MRAGGIPPDEQRRRMEGREAGGAGSGVQSKVCGGFRTDNILRAGGVRSSACARRQWEWVNP